jgi:hypothetical protein
MLLLLTILSRLLLAVTALLGPAALALLIVSALAPAALPQPLLDVAYLLRAALA